MERKRRKVYKEEEQEHKDIHMVQVLLFNSLGGSRGEGGGGGGGATWTAVQGEARGCMKCVLLSEEGGRGEGIGVSVHVRVHDIVFTHVQTFLSSLQCTSVGVEHVCISGICIHTCIHIYVHTCTYT